LSSARNVIPRTNFAPFQAYSLGMITRAGPPCSSASGASSKRVATSTSSSRHFSSATLVE